MIKRTLYHFHFCCGLGGIDVDPAGLRDFERLAGVPGTLLDLFTRDQYVRFHGKEPPAGWREATPEDILTAAGGRLWCLGTTKDGHPRHPLYVPGNQALQPWAPRVTP
ncbi:DUF1643 domain-containing protein [Pseudomonas aeruginosa]|nr:DUF1643 domain-containing protein [Pseudomonas aeruginosa]